MAHNVFLFKKENIIIEINKRKIFSFFVERINSFLN